MPARCRHIRAPENEGRLRYEHHRRMTDVDLPSLSLPDRIVQGKPGAFLWGATGTRKGWVADRRSNVESLLCRFEFAGS